MIPAQGVTWEVHEPEGSLPRGRYLGGASMPVQGPTWNNAMLN